MSSLFFRSGVCHWCHPPAGGYQDTICERHLLELAKDDPPAPVSCDMCVPRMDGRLTALCAKHLGEIVRAERAARGVA